MDIGSLIIDKTLFFIPFRSVIRHTNGSHKERIYLTRLDIFENVMIVWTYGYHGRILLQNNLWKKLYGIILLRKLP